jgi:hypothetical protein
MSALEWVIAAAGAIVTVLVVLGMILLAPANAPPVHEERAETDSNLSPVPAAD